MIGGLEIRPNDRILSLSIPDPETVRAISAQLERGGMVCLGGRDEVYAARRHLGNLPNVLFHVGPPEEIPFDDEYFTLIVDLKCEWSDPAQVAREIRRVLLAGGRAMLAGDAHPEVITVGLIERKPGGELRIFDKPEGSRPAPPVQLPVLR